MNNHASIQLSDLDSIFIMGGRLNDESSSDNTKFLIYSLIDGSIK